MPGLSYENGTYSIDMAMTAGGAGMDDDGSGKSPAEGEGESDGKVERLEAGKSYKVASRRTSALPSRWTRPTMAPPSPRT